MVEVVDDCVKEVTQAISPQDQLERCLSQSIFSPYYNDINEPKEKKEEKKEELKPLLSHLKYAFLGENDTYPLIVSSSLTTNELDKLLRVLRKHKDAIGWSISDLKGISPTVCMHRILLEEGSKPKAQNQMRLNPIMQVVMRKEVLKWLDAEIVYAISDSDWVSPTQVVAKKGGMTVVKGGDDEMIDIRRMSFGLYNSPATFQRCMMSIFHDMVEDIMEVFMDDFSVFDSSFDNCLRNLTRVLQRCEETHLVLNWEKCHFMVRDGIVLGHKIFAGGLEVDRAKIVAIEQWPPPSNEKDAFETLKKALVSASVLISPDWSQPFEIMCDASDVAVGSTLGQKRDKIFRMIYYASRTLDAAQANYTIIEKVIFRVSYYAS
ncbi:uncharacterized protein LOC125199547 [Salvia hispanica]|uniref:uncharacterized protein LOC125199547 n=1 Tax=Salvia hispanica TaxID=49212 RepID=UPI002009AFB0|nr:uncharacterized protein LOC125199547 [Salvia hispanica]